VIIFAVTYSYVDDSATLAAIRPTHREWTAAQLAEGSLLASGPLPDSNGALLIFQAESLSQLAELLNNDPFDIAGLIEERVIQQWNPIFGPWSS